MVRRSFHVNRQGAVLGLGKATRQSSSDVPTILTIQLGFDLNLERLSRFEPRRRVDAASASLLEFLRPVCGTGKSARLRRVWA